MNKSLNVLNKTTTGNWWLIFFLCTLVLSFFTAYQGITHATKYSHLIVIVGGLFGIVFTIVGILLLALLLLVTGWFFRAGVSYTSYVRIASNSALLGLLIALFFHNPVQTILTGALSAAYLSIAIFAVIPLEKRKELMLLIGLMPTILLVLWNVAQWVIVRA